MEVRSPPLKPSRWTGISSPSRFGERPTQAMTMSDCCAALTASSRRTAAGGIQVRSMPAEPVPWRYSRRIGWGFVSVEVHRSVVDGAAFGLFFAGAGDDEFAVEVEAEAFGVFAGVAVVDADADLVIAGRGRSEGAGPADGVVVALQAGDGNDFIPVEIDVAVGAGEDGGAGEVGRREIFAGEAGIGATAGAGRGMERGVFDGDGVTLDEGRALGVADMRRGEALFDAVERVDGRWAAARCSCPGETG